MGASSVEAGNCATKLSAKTLASLSFSISLVVSVSDAVDGVVICRVNHRLCFWRRNYRIAIRTISVDIERVKIISHISDPSNIAKPGPGEPVWVYSQKCVGRERVRHICTLI